MSISEKYISGLKAAYRSLGASSEWDQFEEHKRGASEASLASLRRLYPHCPESLIELLRFVDGTYHRQYGNYTCLLFFLGSDIFEYPYYLLSTEQIIAGQKTADDYDDYIRREYDEVAVDDRITDQPENLNWLHFSDCMNNGGTSQLFIDFSPSPSGKKGQIVRFLHDPDEFSVIAGSFSEYLEKLIADDYGFVTNV